MSNNHECACGHCHEHKNESKALPIILTAAGALLTVFSLLPFVGDMAEKLMQAAAMIICGMPVFADAVKAVSKLKIDESLLLVIAVIAAFLLGEYFEAAVVAVLFRVGELLEDYASDRSRKSIEAVFAIVSDSANLVLPDGTIKKVDADDINIGDVIAVLPHETVPVDGVIVSGAGSMDASAITGESIPVAAEEGCAVSSGMVRR